MIVRFQYYSEDPTPNRGSYLVIIESEGRGEKANQSKKRKGKKKDSIKSRNSRKMDQEIR
ncbi:MAG: hypothetical protein ACMUEL_06910 [Flavobacteriales bacterium Tduv]